MKLIVLDTNVIVSAGINPNGAPAKIIFDWILEGSIELVISPAIIAEYREVLERPKFARFRFPPLWVEYLLEESLHLAEPQPWKLPCPDPDDAPFLAVAQATGAWLVTGNLKHFPDSARGKVRVISPANYLTDLLR